jgi:glycosyltransferase involved in cell wall biosynthesis
MKLHPFNMRRRLIAYHYRKGEYAKVIQRCDSLLLRYPNDVVALEFKARAHTSMRNWKVGWQLYERVFELKPSHADAAIQLARCSVYTKKWETLSKIAKFDEKVLIDGVIQQALSKKLLSLPDIEFIDFSHQQEITYALPDTTLKRWVNLDFELKSKEFLPIDRYCLDNSIGGPYLGHMIFQILERSMSEARNTLHHFIQKYPISMISQWISPSLLVNSEHSKTVTDWLISYINPKEISLQTLEALCASESIPPHVENLVREYLKDCTPEEVKQAIRVIGRKSDPRSFVSDDMIHQMIAVGIDVSDSNPMVHTWMIEHLLRTEDYISLEKIFANNTRGILNPVIKSLENLNAKENEERLVELVRLIIDSGFMLTSQKLRHTLSKILLNIAEPEVAHSFAIESILLEPQDAVSGRLALQAAIKTGCSKLILETADIALNMKSRSTHIDYAAIAIAAIRQKKIHFAEEILKENRLKCDLRAHRTRVGLQFFCKQNYSRTLDEVYNTPQAYRNDNSVLLYELFAILKLKRFSDAKGVLDRIVHPCEKAIASYLLHDAKGEEDLAVSSLNFMTESHGVKPFPNRWLNSGLKFGELYQKVSVKVGQQKNKDLVTVILTTHRWNEFLPIAVNSILNQTHTNFELIVVDDCSPLDDLELYDTLMTDPRIKRIRMHENSGTYACRNAGLEEATGDFITFADSDDWMHPQKLEYSLTTMKESSVSVLVNRFIRISKEGKIWFNGNKLSQFSLVGMVVSAEKLREFDLKFDGRARFGADSEFLEKIELLLGKSNIKRTNFVELLALHHENSLTGGGLNSIDWTGPGDIRQRYANAFRRNLTLIEAGMAAPNDQNFSPPTDTITSKYVSKTHLAIREILGVEQLNYEENLIRHQTIDYTEQVNVFMASYPGGFAQIRDTVECLLNQTIPITRLTIHVNGSKIPSNLPEDPRIKIINSDQNYADNGKFAHLIGVSGYILTVDDDINYPPDYVEKLIHGIEYTERKALVGVHGALLPVGPPVNRWSDYRELRRSHVFSGQHSSYNLVNVIGTGTMGFHSSIGLPDFNKMDTLRMVDLHIAVWAQEEEIPMYIIPRSKDWMTEFEDLGDERIWQQANSNNELQHEMMMTLSKIDNWASESHRVCSLTRGPLSKHEIWHSRELPPQMELSGHKQWSKLSKNPKVTIYIPAYNVEKYIEECVESALKQTYTNFEISIHDDGSSDDTWNILNSKYGKHPKIILNSLPNQGISSATNSAISNGSGELILQLDSDDLIEPNTLTILVAAILEGHVCAYGNFRRINPDGTLIDNGWEVPSYSRSRLLKDMIVHPPRLYRRDVWEFIGRHNENLVNAEDFDLFLRMSEVGTMIHVREILYSYRILQTSSTRSQSEIMTINTHNVVKSALLRQGIEKFEVSIPNPDFPRRISFVNASFVEL